MTAPVSKQGVEQPLAQTMELSETPRITPVETAEQDMLQTVGRYRILGRLGQGAMGTVYLAHDPQLDRQVAIKLPRFDSRDLTARQRFLREARAAASVRHPNVCSIHDVGEEGDRPFVVMDYIPGKSLEVVLEEKQRCEDCVEAATLVAQVAQALAAIHAAGIVHRDLKPANILLDAGGTPLVTDFGLAHSQSDPTHLTVEGNLLGTPAYMSPEQGRGDIERIDGRSDIYSLGVVLYRLLTGHLPHEGTLSAVLTKLQTEPAPLASSFRPDLEPALEAIVMKALARSADDRYSSAEQLAEALSGWLSRRSSSEVLPQKKPRRWKHWAAAGVMLLLLTAWGLTQKSEHKEPGQEGEKNNPAPQPAPQSAPQRLNLDIARVDPITKRPVPLKLGGPPLAVSDELRLKGTPQTGNVWLLCIDGEGTATIKKTSELPADREGGWRWGKMMPSTETLLLLSFEREPTSEECQALAERITKLGTTPSLVEAEQIAWRDGTCTPLETEKGGIARGHFLPPPWTDQVLALLKEVPGLQFHGWTVPVQD